ncbi:MAG: hypothetical protein ACI96M_004356 [Candidatus Azotimanducaceae bacterium]|jgi:hypothetical protein
MPNSVLILISILVLAGLFVFIESSEGVDDLDVAVAGEVAGAETEILVASVAVKQTDIKSIQVETPLWVEVVGIPERMPLIRADIPNKRLIKLNRQKLTNLSAGQTVQVSLPQLRDAVQISIVSVEELASGNLSISGKVDDNSLLDFVMTVSKSSIYATIGTEHGVFNLRGDDALAWIAPGKSFNHHVNPSVLDYRVPKQPVADAAINQG